MIDLDALAAELATVGWGRIGGTGVGLLIVDRRYGAGRMSDFIVTDRGDITAASYRNDGKTLCAVPVDAAFLQALDIVREHIDGSN